MNPDGLSYLDMASAGLHSGPHNLINPLWSPLYPFLMAVSLRLFNPAPSFEIPLIHFLNWIIFLAVALSFAFFLRVWFNPGEREDRGAWRCKGVFVPFSFWILFWSIVQFIPVSLVTPDLCVAGTVFLAAGICGQMARPTADWKNYCALGGALALGYYAKAAMFPAALLLLLLLFAWPPLVRRGRYGVLLAAVAFLVASSPLVVLTSKRLGHLSTSGSGGLNYAWWVNKVPPYGGSIRLEMGLLDSLYQGNLDPSSGLIHPPRVLMDKPLVVEFASPVYGTHPLWYDPYYWNEGTKAHFHLGQQVTALKENLLKYGRAFLEMGGLSAGVLALFLLSSNRRAVLRLERRWCWLLAWPLAVGLMYGLIHVEYRFLGAFFVLFWMAAYGVTADFAPAATRTAVLSAVLGGLIISTLGVAALRHFTDDAPPDYLAVAEGLRMLGVNRGDQLATVGTMFDAYFARPAEVRIAAQVSDPDEFWSLTASDFEEVKDRLASFGVKALIAKDGPRQVRGEWREIIGTTSNRFRVLLLHQQPPGLAAFPGAQGGGALSVGGRGGAVYEVTNLQDSGPGSLRSCLDASGPRTCVFRVAGTVLLTSGSLVVANPYLTVAGQTAPGGGIEISAKNISDTAVKIYTHNVIWRYTRIRIGFTPSQLKDGFDMIGSAHDVIFDHNSVTWTTNENVAIWGRMVGQRNITLSSNLIAEPLANHPINVITGADTHALADQMTDIDAHHNLLMNASHRNPLWKHKSGRWVNNIVYNWSFRATQLGGGIAADIIGNLYKPGPRTPAGIHEVNVYQNYAGNTTTPDGNPSIFIAFNEGPSGGPASDNWGMVFEAAGENGDEMGQLPNRFRRSLPLPVAGVAIVAESVATLESAVLPVVGASSRLDCNGGWVANRDSVDLRLINQYSTGAGSVPNTEDDVGGFPSVATGTPCTDSDHDGIPDAWELAHGLNPNDPSDASRVSANGYTNLENYLAGQPAAPSSVRRRVSLHSLGTDGDRRVNPTVTTFSLSLIHRLVRMSLTFLPLILGF